MSTKQEVQRRIEKAEIELKLAKQELENLKDTLLFTENDIVAGFRFRVAFSGEKRWLVSHYTDERNLVFAISGRDGSLFKCFPDHEKLSKEEMLDFLNGGPFKRE